MKKKKLVFISSIAVPHQVKFCNALQDFYDARFWFYEYPDRTRGSWWRMDLGEYCKVLNGSFFLKKGPFQARYICWQLIAELEAFDPDIVMLGGFSIPGNYFAYVWAKKHSKKTIVFTERSRNNKGVLRKRSLIWRILLFLYQDVDIVIVSADDALEQFRDEFCFADKVVIGRYAADLDDYFTHPLRTAKLGYTYLFANRLTSIYNPVGAIDIFSIVLSRYPGSRLIMNAAGEQGYICKARIAELGIGYAVEFLTNLHSWSELNKVYERSDILLLPASFSNGNFTILEAMASGMGIVSSDRVLGIGKLVKDEHNGFNCEPTIDAFIDRIERYIIHPEIFKVHAEINRQLVKPLSIQGTALYFWKIVSNKI